MFDSIANFFRYAFTSKHTSLTFANGVLSYKESGKYPKQLALADVTSVHFNNVINRRIVIKTAAARLSFSVYSSRHDLKNLELFLSVMDAAGHNDIKNENFTRLDWYKFFTSHNIPTNKPRELK